MDSRRDFIKKSLLLAGGLASNSIFPETIRRALEINPEKGSSFYDAEHIVFLMQENRSFDHLYGCLRGVRGFNDPRTINLPNGNKAWLQTNKEGKTFIPFRLNTYNSKAPWMGSTPHGWADQVDARNNGNYDNWIEVKKPFRKEYAHIPLTMGYCDRMDFPFYYSLADAFTICDQHFSSSITGTHPNRWYWMTGTVREKNLPEGVAHLWNISDYSKPTLNWKTFPERMEEAGIGWKVYQNEITIGSSLKRENESWLGNFGTNVLEYFNQYNVLSRSGAEKFLKERKRLVSQELEKLEKDVSDKSATRIAAAKKVLALITEAERDITKFNFENLDEFQKALNSKAFVTNNDDPEYESLEKISYDDNGVVREFLVPKGDILKNFRDDVRQNRLPMVSWLMSPANFSDHPGQPWFGSWYVNEVMEILLENPEIWKKTIFILTYDENDGFFDHIPPYAVPNPYEADSGKVSKNIDPKLEWVLESQQTNPSADPKRLRSASIGLGYRVPLIIASPWSRGGFVNSQLFDHTSSLQFLENFLSRKTGKKIHDENITTWRREICGDLTSVFRTYNGEKINSPEFIDKNAFLHHIHKSQFKEEPSNYKPLSSDEISAVNYSPEQFSLFPKQEKGTKPSNAIPYELYVDGELDKVDNYFKLNFEASNKAHGAKSSGAPFIVFADAGYDGKTRKVWEYSVSAGDKIEDSYAISKFLNSNYHLKVYGPNGFYREFKGSKENPDIKVTCRYESINKGGQLTGNFKLNIHNLSKDPAQILITDNAYENKEKQKVIKGKAFETLSFDLSKSFGWYDFTVKINGNENFFERAAGHIDTHKISQTDPLMGREL